MFYEFAIIKQPGHFALVLALGKCGATDNSQPFHCAYVQKCFDDTRLQDRINANVANDSNVDKHEDDAEHATLVLLHTDNAEGHWEPCLFSIDETQHSKAACLSS